jgi:4a-hydroxytetrahydrobiopterin dehydratase
MPSLLSQDDLTAALADLPGVHRAQAGHLMIKIQSHGFPAAVQLITQVAEVAEELNHHPDVDLRWNTVFFILSTHSEGGVTARDLDLARRILELASRAGASVLPVRERVEIALDAANPDAVRPFWKTGLGYEEQLDSDGSVVLRSPDSGSSVLWFQIMDPPRPGRGRFHLDVYLPGDQTQQRVADTLAAGGTLVTDRFAPGWWVLADAEGNELCICRA